MGMAFTNKIDSTPYHFVFLDCTQEYTEPTGMISSPDFGGLYPSNANCTYNITLSPSKNVFLKFSLFELEAAPANDSAVMPNGYCADILKVWFISMHYQRINRFSNNFQSTTGISIHVSNHIPIALQVVVY